MMSTRYHVDRVWSAISTWQGLQGTSRPKSKVYNCFIKLSGSSHEIYFNHKEPSMALSTASKIGANWSAYIVTSYENAHQTR